jgi:hypothetical protein
MRTEGLRGSARDIVSDLIARIWALAYCSKMGGRALQPAERAFDWRAVHAAETIGAPHSSVEQEKLEQMLSRPAALTDDERNTAPRAERCRGQAIEYALSD